MVHLGALESDGEVGCGVGSGWVSLHVEGTLTRVSFIICRNQLTLRVLTGQPEHQEYRLEGNVVNTARSGILS